MWNNIYTKKKKENNASLLSRIYFLLIHPTEHLFLTSFNFIRALKRLQV